MRQKAGGCATAGGLTRSVRSPRHLVAGEWRSGDGDELLDVGPTRPGETGAVGHLAQDRDLDQAVVAASDAFPRWAATFRHVSDRILDRTADALDAHAEPWGEELSCEEGKTRAEGLGEVRRAAEVPRYHASEVSRPVGEAFTLANDSDYRLSAAVFTDGPRAVAAAEQGRAAREFFTRTKTVYVRPSERRER